LFARRQEGDDDRYPGEDGLLDCGKILLGAWNLDEQIGRFALANNSFAASMVLALSQARNGDTSSETHPSTPLVFS
jgi:hypothetical protein